MWNSNSLTMTCLPCGGPAWPGLPAGHFVRALRAPDARDKAQSSQAAEKPATFVATQHCQGLTIFARILDRRGSRRLPPHVLEIHPAPPGARSDRAGLERRPLRASPHHVRARSLRGQGQCLALLGEGADARTRNHAAGVTGGMAARDCAQARSARGLFHAEAIANAEAGEEEENGAEDGLNGG